MLSAQVRNVKNIIELMTKQNLRIDVPQVKHTINKMQSTEKQDILQ